MKESGRFWVIGTDIVDPSGGLLAADVFHPGLDIAKKEQSTAFIRAHQPHWVIHLAAFLSCAAEDPANFDSTIRLNLLCVNHLLQLARRHHFGLFCPSSIAVFNRETASLALDDAPTRPAFLYGITKAYTELIGEYFHRRYGVDFRSLRLPGVIGPAASTSQGTTDYAVGMLRAFATREHEYTCPLGPTTRLPMIHIDDCVTGLVKFLSTPRSSLTRSVYNIHSFSLAPAELAHRLEQITGHRMNIIYQPDRRQAIAASWPEQLDDSRAQKDWNWAPKVDLNATIASVLSSLGFERPSRQE